MIKIYSKVEPNRLLHFVHKSDDFSERVDLVSPEQVLQLSSQKIESGSKFRAHRHLAKSLEIYELTAQESWVVIRGIVRASFYDLDDRLLDEIELEPGDASVTLAGGHGYECIQEALVYEFKTGPYLGLELDKTFI
jgi:hypothetical protein